VNEAVQTGNAGAAKQYTSVMHVRLRSLNRALPLGHGLQQTARDKQQEARISSVP
jgi:hypothetical protein